MLGFQANVMNIVSILRQELKNGVIFFLLAFLLPNGGVEGIWVSFRSFCIILHINSLGGGLTNY